MLETKREIFDFLVDHTIQIAQQVEVGETSKRSEEFRRDMNALWNNATDSDKGCPHCLKGMPLIDDAWNYIGIEHETKRMFFNSDKAVGHDEVGIIHIKYCPECGAKL